MRRAIVMASVATLAAIMSAFYIAIGIAFLRPRAGIQAAREIVRDALKIWHDEKL